MKKFVKLAKVKSSKLQTEEMSNVKGGLISNNTIWDPGEIVCYGLPPEEDDEGPILA